MTLYRIRDWEETFLSDKTRGRLGRLKYVQVPVKLDDLDYIRLMGMKDGASHFGVWIALVELAASQNARDGALCSGNTDAFTLHDLSLLTRIPERTLELGIKALTEIGWLVSEAFGNVRNDSETPPLERSGEERSGEEKETSADADPFALWNLHCAPLPRALSAKDKTRRSRWAAFLRAAGEDAQGAVTAAARDPFYREKRYGIDTFLRHQGRWIDAARNGEAGRDWDLPDLTEQLRAEAEDEREAERRGDFVLPPPRREP